MDSDDRERRQRLVVEGARKQLANGTWPQVMAVFGYPTPKAPRTTDEEFARLKVFYEQKNCMAMAKFIDLVRFTEKENGITMSFNLSMRLRPKPGEKPEPTPENIMLLFSCPDILVGTRGGVEGAAVWFKNLSEATPRMAPESLQVVEKIFGKAVEILQDPSNKVPASEMFQSVFLDETLERPRVSKH